MSAINVNKAFIQIHKFAFKITVETVNTKEADTYKFSSCKVC